MPLERSCADFEEAIINKCRLDCGEAVLRESNSFSGSTPNQTIVETRDSLLTGQNNVSNHTHVVQFETSAIGQ